MTSASSLERVPAHTSEDIIPTSTNRNRSDRVWGRVWELFGKERVAGRYGLSSKTCNAAEQSPNAALWWPVY